MHPPPLPYWNDFLWDKQAEVDDDALAVNSEKVFDISAFLSSDGTLHWDVPEGEWIIVRTGMRPTGTTNSPASPEATGYEVDKITKEEMYLSVFLSHATHHGAWRQNRPIFLVIDLWYLMENLM